MLYSDTHFYAPQPGPFSRYLRGDEAVLWRGSPFIGAYETSRLKAVALFLASFLVFLLVCRLHPYVSIPSGALTLIVGAIAVRRAIVAARARIVEYALTEERILVFIGGRRSSVLTYDLKSTPVQELEEDEERRTWDYTYYRTGNIRFLTGHRSRCRNWLGLPDPVREAYAPAFVTLQAPRDVYRVIEDARDLPRLRGAGGGDLRHPAESRETAPER